MNTIEKNSESNGGDVAQSKPNEHKLQSTITIEPKAPEHIQVEENESEEDQEQVHSVDEENEEEFNPIAPSTTDTSTSMIFHCSSKHPNVYI